MHLLFDLDGTLTDSRPGIILSLQHALAETGLPVPAAEDLHWCIGPPILETFRKLVATSPEQFEPAVIKYRERYSLLGLYENELYPEIPETLAELRGLGHVLHVATSKAEIYARPIIEHFGLGGYFASIHGSELDGTRANKADLIAHILGSQGISADDAVMIGDRSHDMIGAVANGVTGIGALWGYGTGGELMDAGASFCVRVPRLLPELISSLE